MGNAFSSDPTALPSPAAVLAQVEAKKTVDAAADEKRRRGFEERRAQLIGDALRRSIRADTCATF